MEVLARGIDISKWQGDVDFCKVKNSGVDFVILREGAGTYIDKKFMEYVKQCKAAGLPIEAVYHFSYALSNNDAIKEAELAIQNVKNAGLSKDTIIFFDFEYDTVKRAAEKGVSLTRKECIDFSIAFCDMVKAFGYKTGIYCNIDYYKNWYNKSTIDKYIFWLADYTGGPNYACEYQQYSSKGQVDGIKGNVDMNYRYKPRKYDTPVINTSEVDKEFIKNNIRIGQINANNFIGFIACEPNGIRDKKTKVAAAMVLQTAMNLDYKAGLKVDGDIGPLSKAALKGHYVQYGETQYMVTALEILLLLKGYNAGIEVPGIYGEKIKSIMGDKVEDYKFYELIE